MAKGAPTTVQIEVEGEKPVSFSTHFVAYGYRSEAAAKATWERATQGTKAMGVSIWRVNEPLDPPHRFFRVIVCGEDRRDVRAVERILKEGAGAKRYEVPYDLKEALALRRYRSAIARLDDRVDPGLLDGRRRTGGLIMNRGMSHALTRDGTMERP